MPDTTSVSGMDRRNLRINARYSESVGMTTLAIRLLTGFTF